eukprot:4652594-Prymnesium_polylepis.2
MRVQIASTRTTCEFKAPLGLSAGSVHKASTEPTQRTRAHAAHAQAAHTELALSTLAASERLAPVGSLTAPDEPPVAAAVGGLVFAATSRAIGKAAPLLAGEQDARLAAMTATPMPLTRFGSDASAGASLAPTSGSALSMRHGK